MYVEIRGPKPDKGIFVSTVSQPTRDPWDARSRVAWRTGRGSRCSEVRHREPDPPIRFSEDGERTYNRRLGVWERAPARPDAKTSPPTGRGASPLWDGSGTFWRAGYWTIEAIDYDAARSEVDRLCSVSGISSGNIGVRVM